MLTSRGYFASASRQRASAAPRSPASMRPMASLKTALGAVGGCIGTDQYPLGVVIRWVAMRRRSAACASTRRSSGSAAAGVSKHEHGVRRWSGPRGSAVNDLARAHQLVDRAVRDRADDAADDRFVETRRAVHLDRHAGLPEHAHRGNRELVLLALGALRIDVALVDQVVLVQVDAGHRRIVGDPAQDIGGYRISLGAGGRFGACLLRILRGGQEVRRITDALAVDAFRVDGDVEVAPVARIAVRVQQRHQHHRAHGAELRNVVDRISDGVRPGGFLAVDSGEYPDRGSGGWRAQRDDRQWQVRARGRRLHDELRLPAMFDQAEPDAVERLDRRTPIRMGRDARRRRKHGILSRRR